MLLILTIILVVRSCIGERNQFVETDASQPDIDVQLLDVNPYSRPGIESEGVKGVVIHYTANPGSTAQDNRDYLMAFNIPGRRKQAVIYCRIGWRDHTMCTDMGDRLCIE